MKILFITLNFFLGCSQKNSNKTDKMKETQHTNNLINESSPYLLQHAHNPVNWYPWCNEALEKAKEENKLIIISIGYAACHWCHVMEHESFEDSTVAEIMNKYYISIKVDREERPDIDHVYMDAAYAFTGGGGWPLNIVALPDGRPVFAGTYFPKSQWLQVLNNIQTVYEDHPDKVEQQAQHFMGGMKEMNLIQLPSQKSVISKSDLDNLFLEGWNDRIDYDEGGRIGAPKFPMPNNWDYLMHYYFLTKNEEALEAVESTLTHMANGGIYDHVGGGFARYATDETWHIPHFEKMLFDNAQLVSLYSHAYQLTKNELYKEVVLETLEFIKREMTSPGGGFYSSLDADSEGEEGKYYSWQIGELKKILGNEADFIIDYFNVTDSGNWEEGKNVLFVNKEIEEVAKKHGISTTEAKQKVITAKEKLLTAREKRIKPALDDKQLTSWNAMMIKAYVDAYRVFGKQEYLEAGLKNASFLIQHAVNNDNSLTRNFKDGKSSISGFLDDYALVIEAYISLYQATFDEKWLYYAEQMMDYTIESFYDDKDHLFFYRSRSGEQLIIDKKELEDNVIPASNSIIAKDLFVLGSYFYEKHPEYLAKARSMLEVMRPRILQSPMYHSNWLILATWFVQSPYEVAIVGKDFLGKRQELDQHYLPYTLMLGGAGNGKLPLLENKLVDGQTTIYVCQDKSCKLPVTEVEKALELMN